MPYIKQNMSNYYMKCIVFVYIFLIFIVRQYKRRSVEVCNDICHCKCFTGARHSQKCLVSFSFKNPLSELFYRLRLISRR